MTRLRNWRPPRRALTALVLYAVLSVALIGMPVIGDLASRSVSLEEIEPSGYIWFIGWWPFALLSGENPLTTDYIFYPEGYNVAWAGGNLAGPSIVLAPATLAFGPVVTYNLLALAAPALSAFTAFLLCRRLTGSFWPSVAGGYAFGFSGLVLGALTGVPNFALVFMLPVFPLLVVRFVAGSLSRRRFGAYLALALIAQFLISAEVFALVTVLGGLVAVAAYALSPRSRPRLRAAVAPALAAYVATALLVSPLLYQIFFEPHLEPQYAIPEHYSSDLLSIVIPTDQQALSGGALEGIADDFAPEDAKGAGGGGNAYLGIGLVAIIVLFALESWRTVAGKLLAGTVAALAVFSLGPRLHVGGELVPGGFLPWKPFSELPLLEYALPARFAMFTALSAAVILALWLARRPSAARWLAAGAAIALLLPAVGSERWQAPADTPAFFQGPHERHLGPDDHVLAVPPIGPIQRWQAVTGFDFRITSGYVGRVPDDYEAVHRLLGGWPPGAPRELRGFVSDKDVTAILVAEDQELWRERLRFLGVEPVEADGMLLYRLAEPSPSG